MVVLLLIVLAVFWLVLQGAMHDNGVSPLSRGQHRYLRRKARRMGVDVSEVPYRPRRGTHPFPDGDGFSLSPATDDQEGSSPVLLHGVQRRDEWPSPLPPGWSPPD